MLTVEVLGPLRVSVAGQPVELPAGRLRALLAVLAMSAGRTVPTDQLATAVWGADPRGDARANVRTNVKRLRGVLGSGLIVARAGGYVLDVAEDQVDALRFGRLLDEAVGAGPAQRSQLAAALSLWRGTPFDGIRSDWLARSVAPALAERYLTAVERRVDLDLASGARPDPTELVALAERHPLRESLWVRLLRVLESAGRPAEALERYETIRRRLAEELGADPSAELRQAHADLLAGDAVPSSGAVPRQLPAAVDGFAGREAELAALDALPAPRVVVIAGTAGVGKTTLATHWAHRIADRFPDGQLYVALRGYDPSGEPVRPAAAIRELLDALRVPPQRIPDSLSAQAGLYRSVLAGRRLLVLLDNARDAEQVTPLLPGEPGCLVVITSRDHLAGLVMTYGAHPVTLDVLPPDQARQLLASRLGANRIASDPAATDEIIRRCAGLPLALAIVTARAVIQPAYPLSALAADLLDQAVDVRAIFSWSYDTLSDAAARLFRLVGGLHPGPYWTIAAAASLADVPVSAARASLAELTGANLLTEHSPGRYSAHDLLRAYAAELCATHDADRSAAQHRIVDYYVRSAEAGEPEEALLETLTLAVDLGLDQHVCRLAQALSGFLRGCGRWHDQVETQQAAVAAAARLGSLEQTGAHRDLGRALADLGRFDEAHRNLDIALALAHDDLAGQAWTHYERDIIYMIQCREADALSAAQRAHDLFEQLGDEVGLASTLTDLGWYHGRLGDHSRALELCGQALVRHQKLGNRPYEAHTWSCLADTHLRLGDAASAVVCHRNALDVFRALGDRYAEASTLAHLGACHHVAGDVVVAGEQWRAAHALLGDLDSATVDQIYGQLVAIDPAAAAGFRRG